MGIELDIDELVDDFEDAGDEIRKGASRGVEKFSRKVEAQAVEWTPFEYGTLQQSARTDEEGELSYTVSFNTHYAIYVHERTELEHDQGRAKYLEEAMKAKRGDFESTVVGEVKKEL